MTKRKVTLIPGDGIGPEVSLAMQRCVDATGAAIEWETVNAGTDVMEKMGTPLPEEVLESVRRNKIAIKGPVTTPVGSGFRSVNVALRKELDLFACLRPCKLYDGIQSLHPGVDLIIVRENTEDLYAGIEFDANSKEADALVAKIKELNPKAKFNEHPAISIKPISQKASERIIRFAFETAVKEKRRKVTAVHKANIMKCTDGLFLRVAREIAKEYEGRIQFEDRIVDNMCMQLVQRPREYDVVVLPNLYGDILSDLCAGLIGGLGIAPGANIGDGIALFEATHGSAPKYRGLNKANPTAMILSAVLMLHFIGEQKAADKLESAVARVLKEGKFVTYDLKEDRNDPTAVGTSQMADAIIKEMGSLVAASR
ncbi:MAG TPA: isocitrate/isopropylmalate dehydrogenase family protein [Candidatus Eisenbacteria bacterium]|jgi:isocitrate dehydrogenase (NAD+)|nr:isocitrate/isopropylmalate dehydrogenase family protein [Candidatus Eisenbacteria bacterium]